MLFRNSKIGGNRSDSSALRSPTVLLLLGFIFLFAAGCGSSPDASMDNSRANVAEVDVSEASQGEEVSDTQVADDEAEQPQTTVADPTEAPPTETVAPTDTPAPTNTPAPTATPEPTMTPTPPPVGIGRSNPFGVGELVTAPNWDVQVLEVIRGEDAWALITQANQFNDPPSEGNEYILVRISATSTYADDEAHRISDSDFKLTGNRLVRYRPASVVSPEPELDAELFAGGQAEGWAVFEVGQEESELMLIVDELFSFDDDRFRYIALEPDAAIAVDPALAAIRPTELGVSRSEPAAPGEMVTVDNWEITVLDAIRGDDAWALIQQANQFNEPPADGNTYHLVRIGVRNVSSVDEANSIDGFDFNLTGGNLIFYDNPSIVEPDPSLDYYLYPGGMAEGWIAMESGAEETGLMLVFEPAFSFSDEDVRYLAIDEGASLGVPVEIAAVTANALGENRSAPATSSDVVITDNWEISVLETVRGDEAWLMAQEANQFNDPPEEGFEYIAIRIAARNVNDSDEHDSISDSNFSIVGSQSVQYDNPPVVDPDPALDARLYPGGRTEGWIVLQIAEGEEDLVLIFGESFSFDERYISLNGS